MELLTAQTRRTAMRTSEAFVLGAIMGAAVVWLWGNEMEEYVQERTRGVRTKAAESVRAVEETAGKVLDRGGDALRRADDFLQDTKGHVSEALRAGQEAIRPHQQPDSQVGAVRGSLGPRHLPGPPADHRTWKRRN
jgi:gas vesicle protein